MHSCACDALSGKLFDESRWAMQACAVGRPRWAVEVGGAVGGAVGREALAGRLAKEVRAALERVEARVGLAPDVEKFGAHAVNVADDGARQRLQRVRELDHLVAVGLAEPHVERL
eukprot:3455570-Pleurochrysis_carterae.AAC.1